MNEAHVYGTIDEVPLEAFFGPELRPRSHQIEQQGRAMMHHFHHVVEPCLQRQANQGEEDMPSRIPKIIHMIWLGTSEMPTRCLSSWRQLHPEWELRVWTNADLKQHEWHNREVLEYAMNQELFGMASDVLRLEVLWRLGGLYVDVDYMCVARVDDLQDSLDFYCGASCTRVVEVNNGLLASRPQFPLVSQMIKAVQKWWSDRQTTFAQVAAFLGSDASGLAVATQVSANDILSCTGPGLLTRTIGTYLRSNGVTDDACYVAVFPYSYFHPMPNTERNNWEAWRDYVRQNETRAVHLWGCSWQCA